MSLPKPLPGLVVHYEYLWAEAAAQGHEEGEKARPAAIIMAIQDPGNADVRVYVLPITHAKPGTNTVAMAIPPAVAKSAGLDAQPCWIILSEFNEFVWPGFDLAAIPGRNPPTMAYGFLTPGFFNDLRNKWLALDAAQKSQSVARDVDDL